MRSGLHAALHIAVCLLVLAGPGLAAQTAPSDGSPDHTGTTITIDLRADGDAHITVSTTFALNGSNETAAFAALGEDFERGGRGGGYSVGPFRRAVAAANETADRRMSLGNVSYEAIVDNGTTPGNATGRLALSFEWRNFSSVEGDTLRVGDAFETPDGTWLPGLTGEQRLVMELPDGYTLLDANAPIEDGALVWRGPTEFDDTDLDVVLERGRVTPTTPGQGPNVSTPPGDGNGSGPGDEDGPTEGFSMPLFGSVALVVGTVALGAYVFASRDGDLAASALDTDGGGAGAAAVAGGSAAGDVATPDEDDDIDEELLSDEERVERLLRANGGRMRQADIVTETGWSNAKVSQLLSAMDDAGRVDKLRIGRENLISLPGVETGIGDRNE